MNTKYSVSKFIVLVGKFQLSLNMSRLLCSCSLLWFMNMILFSSCESATMVEEEEVITFIEHLYGGTGGVTVGSDDHIYVSDFGPWLGGGISNLNPTNRVYKINPDGQVEVFSQGFIGASGSKFDDSGNFYQSNVRKGVVSKISKEGIMDSTFVDGLIAPVGISLDDDENLYINNCGDNKIIVVDPKGIKKDFCTDSLLNCPNGITRDKNGNFYVSNFYNGDVVKITPEGEASLLANIPGNNNGHIVFHDNGLYVVARSSHQIYKVSLDGEVKLFAGTGKRGRINGDRMESTFSYPNDIDVSLDGKYMYLNEIADTISDHRVLTPMSIRRIRME